MAMAEAPKIVVEAPKAAEAPKVEVKVEAPKAPEVNRAQALRDLENWKMTQEPAVAAREMARAEHKTEVAKEGAKAKAIEGGGEAAKGIFSNKFFQYGISILVAGIAMSAAVYILTATIDKTLETMGFSKADRTTIYWAIGALIAILVFYFVFTKIKGGKK